VLEARTSDLAGVVKHMLDIDAAKYSLRLVRAAR
jgi:hypothetical protein